jgi:hypothetical protein
VTAFILSLLVYSDTLINIVPLSVVLLMNVRRRLNLDESHSPITPATINAQICAALGFETIDNMDDQLVPNINAAQAEVEALIVALDQTRRELKDLRETLMSTPHPEHAIECGCLLCMSARRMKGIKEEMSRVAFFINGLDDTLADLVTAARPRTIHKAYSIANAIHPRQPKPAVNVVATSDVQRPRPQSAGADRTGPAIIPPNVVCWTCGETDHIAKFCLNGRNGFNRPRPNTANSQQRYGNSQKPCQNRYPQRPPKPGQSSPGPHKVQQSTAGANPYCTRCGVAHVFGSHIVAFKGGPRR